MLAIHTLTQEITNKDTNNYCFVMKAFTGSELWALLCWHAGVKAQVASIEQATFETPKKVEAPMVVVTGASGGIDKAISLSLGRAGCNVHTYIIAYLIHAITMAVCTHL